MERVLNHRGNRLKHRYAGSFFLNSQSVTVNYMKQDTQYQECPSRKRNGKSKKSYNKIIWRVMRHIRRILFLWRRSVAGEIIFNGNM